MAGLIPGHAEHLLDLDVTILLAFLEGVICENEDNAKRVQEMYDAARPPAPKASGEQRRADVARFMAIAG